MDMEALYQKVSYLEDLENIIKLQLHVGAARSVKYRLVRRQRIPGRFQRRYRHLDYRRTFGS